MIFSRANKQTKYYMNEFKIKKCFEIKLISFNYIIVKPQQ